MNMRENVHRIFVLIASINTLVERVLKFLVMEKSVQKEHMDKAVLNEVGSKSKISNGRHKKARRDQQGPTQSLKTWDKKSDKKC